MNSTHLRLSLLAILTVGTVPAALAIEPIPTTPIRIVGVPTVREPDGLAMSSRNVYLNPEERKSALCLKKSLDLARDMAARGETSTSKVKRALQELILSHPCTVIDYVSLCDPGTLEDVETVKEEVLLALAVKVGKTRLIDNGLLNEASESDIS